MIDEGKKCSLLKKMSDRLNEEKMSLAYVNRQGAHVQKFTLHKKC